MAPIRKLRHQNSPRSPGGPAKLDISGSRTGSRLLKVVYVGLAKGEADGGAQPDVDRQAPRVDGQMMNKESRKPGNGGKENSLFFFLGSWLPYCIRPLPRDIFSVRRHLKNTIGHRRCRDRLQAVITFCRFERLTRSCHWFYQWYLTLRRRKNAKTQRRRGAKIRKLETCGDYQSRCTLLISF